MAHHCSGQGLVEDLLDLVATVMGRPLHPCKPWETLSSEITQPPREPRG